MLSTDFTTELYNLNLTYNIYQQYLVGHIVIQYCQIVRGNGYTMDITKTGPVDPTLIMQMLIWVPK